MSSREKLAEEKIKSEKVYSGALLQVYKDKVELPDGVTSEREYIKHPGAAVIIPYNEKGEILLIKQYRYPIRDTILELPAGKIDPGENPEESIDRELAEETGFGAKNIKKLSRIHSCVGYSDEVVHLFWGSELYKNKLEGDEGENIVLAPMTIDRAMGKLYSGEITDAKTTIGLFWANRIINSDEFRAEIGIAL